MAAVAVAVLMAAEGTETVVGIAVAATVTNHLMSGWGV